MIRRASSSTYASIKKNAKFEFGIAPLPYYPDVPARRRTP